MERVSEKNCREGFTKLLLKTIDSEDIHWEKVQDDPPDYFLLLFGKKRFAVEVTESKIYCKSIVDKEQVLEKEYRNYHNRFVKQIEQEAKENGLLRGAYCIGFKFPVFKSNKYKNFLSKIKKQYFQYIEETRHLESADKRDLLLENVRISSIKKIHQNKDIIYPTLGMRFAWVNSSQNMQNVRTFLQEAINDKKEKLEKKAIREPKILLLYDSYLLDEIPTYSFENQSLENIGYFHTIFIQFAGDEGLIFYSKDTNDFNKESAPNFT